MRTLARPRDRAELIRRLNIVSPKSAALWGRMSAHQMICHVGDALGMACGEKTVSPAGGVLQQTIVKWMALYVPMPWPAGILTRPEIDQEAGGTKPADFAGDVGRVELLLERLATEHGIMRPMHPIFGRMSRKAWLRWAYVHTDHHLRQFGA